MTLTIHIGTQKSGTSAIQKYCALNRNELIEQNLNYSLFGRGPAGQPAEHAHHVLAHFWGKGWLSDVIPQEQMDKAWCNFKTSLETTSGKHVLISSEHFYKAAVADRSIPQKIRDDLGGTDVRIVVYFRRPDSFALSNWSHNIKTVRDFRLNFAEYVDTQGLSDLLAYENNLRNWQNAFGKENVTVRVYERSLFNNGDAIDDFLEVMQCHKTAEMAHGGDTNVSLSPFTLDLINTLDRTEIKRYNQFIATLENFATKHISKNRSKALLAMTDELSNKILDKFGEQFHSVSKEVIEDGIDVDSLRPQGKQPHHEPIDNEVRALALALWHPVKAE